LLRSASEHAIMPPGRNQDESHEAGHGEDEAPPSANADPSASAHAVEPRSSHDESHEAGEAEDEDMPPAGADSSASAHSIEPRSSHDESHEAGEAEDDDMPLAGADPSASAHAVEPRSSHDESHEAGQAEGDGMASAGADPSASHAMVVRPEQPVRIVTLSGLAHELGMAPSRGLYSSGGRGFRDERRLLRITYGIKKQAVKHGKEQYWWREGDTDLERARAALQAYRGGERAPEGRQALLALEGRQALLVLEA